MSFKPQPKPAKGKEQKKVRKTGGSDIITDTSSDRFSSGPYRAPEGPRGAGNMGSGWKRQVLQEKISK